MLSRIFAYMGFLTLAALTVLLPFSFYLYQQRLLIRPNSAEASTALTSYFTSTTAVTITTADEATSTAPAAETNKTTKIGKSTGWVEVWSQGTTSNNVGASEPAADGHGFLWDVTTLGGQQIVAGNWTPTVKLAASTKSFVADIYVRAYKRSSSGTYTQIFRAVKSAQTINTTATVFTLTATSTPAAVNFNAGDKLYYDVVLDITSTSETATTATALLYENGGANEEVITPGYQVQPVTTLANGTEPAGVTIGPGANATTSDVFTFQTNVGTSSITQINVALSTSTGIYQVEITDNSGATIYGSSTNPGSTSLTISLSGMNVSNTLTTFRTLIAPLSATSMRAPPGGTYIVTSTITGWTDGAGNGEAGSNTTSSVITIDNQSPADVTNASGTAGNAQVALSWINPSDTDYNSAVVLRATSSVSVAPTEGTTYSLGNTINATTTVACVVASSTASCTDTGLTNGATYYYKIFAADNYANYSVGVAPTGNPFTPSAGTVSCSASPSSISFGTLATSTVNTATQNVSSTFSCTFSSGCTLFVQDAGSGALPGLYDSTAPTHLIPSLTATLAAGTEGYGIQAATTTDGSGATLTLNSTYNVAGNAVGALGTSSVALASSSATFSNRVVVTNYLVAISASTLGGSYSDIVTYSCTSN